MLEGLVNGLFIGGIAAYAIAMSRIIRVRRSDRTYLRLMILGDIACILEFILSLPGTMPIIMIGVFVAYLIYHVRVYRNTDDDDKPKRRRRKIRLRVKLRMPRIVVPRILRPAGEAA